MRYRLLLPVLAMLAGPALADEQQMHTAMELIKAWVHGNYDNTAQAQADIDNNVPDEFKHRQMFQLFVPIEMPNIPGHTVYQQASVDGSLEPDRIWRNGVLQFFADPDTNTIRERELNFKEPEKFHNAQFRPDSLRDLTLDAFTWNPGCDFFLKPDADGTAVRGRVGDCRLPLPGRDGDMIADDEVVITPDEFWFLGRYKDEVGNVMWGNASDEHVKMRRTASVEDVLAMAPGGN
ncbi:MAG: CpcT/CpeT family chromophore lyase [Gammaproteobacteria bacterium]|nr:CpcT/CpeT family chromophore lyase [Gammaproteobacteria bacterium]